jgi:cell wall-associated NlpC family hydrolase
VAVFALVCTGTAGARTAAVQVLAADGNTLSAAASFPYAYPEDGSLVRVQAAATSTRGVTLRNVTLLGGRVHADEVFVPAHGATGAHVDGLIVDGLAVPAGAANDLIPLGGGDYLVALQAARIGAQVGLVGLRLTSAGEDVVIGPAAAAQAQAPRRQASARWSLLGFATLPTAHGTPVLEPFPTLLQASADGPRAVQLALQFLGIPYVWGGATPAGFDCSGLVMYVYAQLGIPLTHYSGAQFHEGAAVPRDELQPGDIVFFDASSRGPQHEGMYIGNDEFVHAPHTGDVVKVSSLADPAYALRYVGAVRPGT